MVYYKLTPFQIQYFFPENFKDYSLFDNFYNPYSFKAKIYFCLWKNSSIIRFFCKQTSLEEYISIDILEKFLNNNLLLAFNRGTNGTEQKTTILGKNLKTNDEFFLKYADNELSIMNVINEVKILTQLDNLDIAPRLIESDISENYAYFKTTVINGDRTLSRINVEDIFNTLIKISNQNIQAEDKFSSNLKLCFGHGDFTPWNMMLYRGNIKVYDWESAGYYPLGYDLFTYLIQPFILLKTHKSIEDLLSLNKSIITKYFESFKIKKWKPYLLAFIECKLQLTYGNDIHKNYIKLKNEYKK